jgi:hypothetical protein
VAKEPEGETVLTSLFAFMLAAVHALEEAAVDMTFRLPSSFAVFRRLGRVCAKPEKMNGKYTNRLQVGQVSLHE